jgi:hypothetical protein
MFFRTDEVDCNLTCPRCKTKFLDPRIIIPCLETLCNNCIEQLTENNEINCYFCDVKHPISDLGFGSNKILAKLLEVKANEINRSQNAELLKQNLKQCQIQVDEYKSKIDNSQFIISEHCRVVKTQINLFFETKMRELDDSRNKMLKEVDIYEVECSKHWQELDTKLLRDQVDQMSKFISECTDYLNKFLIDENVISEKRRDAFDHLDNLDKLQKELKGAQFNGRLLTFKQSELNVDSIGEFGHDELEMPQHVQNLSKKIISDNDFSSII